MMMLTPVLLVALASQPVAEAVFPPIDPCDSIVIHQVRDALGKLDDAVRTHQGPSGRAVIAVYEGTHALEAHLMRPDQTWDRRFRLELAVDPSASAMRIRKTTNPQGQARVQTTLMYRGRVAEQSGIDKLYAEVDPSSASEAAADGACWFPSSALELARQSAPSCRPGPPLDHAGRALFAISFTDQAWRACTLLLDSDHRLSRIERLAAHPRLGDTCHWTQFDDWEQHAEFLVPRRITRFIIADSTTSRYDLTLVSVSADPLDGSVFMLPAEHRGDIPDWGQPLPLATGMEFVEIGPGVCTVEIAAADQRVIVIERKQDLVLIGAPHGDAVCNALLAALEERYDGKKVAVAAPTHHHPASSGGLRALAAAGVAIVIPRELEPFARRLISRPTSLGPPGVPGPDQPWLELFDHRTTIECGPTRVELIDIAEHSAHAFRYVVFHIPELGLIFQDDLGYFPLTGATMAGPRLVGLVSQIEELGIAPRRLIQGWPVKNVLREVEWSVVADLVHAARREQQP